MYEHIRGSVSDPDPLARDTYLDPDPSITKQNCKKTFICTVLRLLYDFLSLENDVNTPSKSNKQKK
jgi:hypothetical protein